LGGIHSPFDSPLHGRGFFYYRSADVSTSVSRSQREVIVAHQAAENSGFYQGTTKVVP
jgi:hypothetical protein